MRQLISVAVSWILAGVLAACGVPDSRAQLAREEPPRDRPRAAAVGRVVCEDEGTSVRTPRIRARRDGIHIVFINESGADEFYMRGKDDPDNNHGGYLRERRQRDVSSHGPGIMWVACFDKGDHLPFYDFDERYAEFEIVDPKRLWTSWEVECSESRHVEDRRLRDARTQSDVFDWLRDRFDLPPGEFERPGYPETGWKGNPWVLQHGEQTIANVLSFKEKGSWLIYSADVCTE